MKNTRVYLMSTENVKDPRTFASWKEYLPRERWEKTVRPIKEEDRKTELAAWLLLYQALKEWGISEEKINIHGAYCYGKHGKPMRKDREVYFNLSHSGKYVLCVVAETEIGCDIEKVKEVKWKLAKRFFSEGEYDFLERLGRQEKIIKREKISEQGKADKQEKIAKQEEVGKQEKIAKQKEVGKQQNVDKQKEKEEIKGNVYTVAEAFTRFWVLRESYVKKTGEGLGIALSGLDFSDISDYNNTRVYLKNDFNNLHTPICQTRSKGKKNGEFLKETFFEMEYDGYRIAVCGEKDSKPEFYVCSGTIDNCFL